MRRLGLKIHTNGIGWALLDDAPTGSRTTRGVAPIAGDPAEAALALAKERGAREVALVLYATEASFAGSLPDREGLSWEIHKALVGRTMMLLRDAKIEVKVDRR